MCIRKRDNDYVDYEVIGAGNLRISNSCTWQCGGKKGFSIGAEWGKHGYAGGVISNEDAIRLARHILRTVNLGELIPDED